MLHEINNIISDVIEATQEANAATTPETIETNAAQEATTEANAEPIEEEAPEEIEEEDEEIDDFDPANSERVKDAKESGEIDETIEALEELVKEIGASELDEMDDDDVIFLIAANLNGESYDDVKNLLKYQDYQLYDDCSTLEEVGERYYEETGMLDELEKAVGNMRYVTIDYEQWARDVNIESSNQYVNYGDFSGYVLWYY